MNYTGHPIIRAVMRRMPLFVLQMAVIWSRRIAWAVLLFIWMLFFAAVSFTGSMETASAFMHAVWIGNLLTMTAAVMILYAGTRQKYGFFKALGEDLSWSRAQTSAIMLTMAPPILICWGASALIFGSVTESLWNSLISLLFIFTSASAVFGSLQPRLIALPPTRQYAVVLLISGPWILTAWLLGLNASERVMAHASPLMPICALGALAAVESALGALYRRSPNKYPASCEPKGTGRTKN